MGDLPLRLAALLAGLLCLTIITEAQPAQLKLATVNLWSGLDYQGTWCSGEFESSERRESRYNLLLAQLRRIDADVILLQEVNPVASMASRLASALGCDEIHQVVNAGIKLGCVGIPGNLKEGIAILTKKGLRLKRAGIRKLSGSFGLHGDAITIHTNEASFALAGEIRVDGIPLFIVNTHLTAAPERDTILAARYEALRQSGAIGVEEYLRTLRDWDAGVERRAEEIRALCEMVAGFPEGIPVIVGGDFNCSPGAEELRPLLAAGFFDPYHDALDGNASEAYTWNPERNTNITYSTSDTDASGERKKGLDLLSALFDMQARRIDHILPGPMFRPPDILDAGPVIDSSVDGLYASDHFGFQATLELNEKIRALPRLTDSLPAASPPGFQVYPILSYDTDAGFGYGATTVAVNLFGLRESFDFLGFNSTRGERWYRFIFSLPDRELRQGKIYPLAADLTVDYDKWIGYRYFGTGSRSALSEEEKYTREPLICSLALSRGFSTSFVAQTGVRYRILRNFNFPEGSRLATLPPVANAGTVRCGSLFASCLYDTRDSFINPSDGDVLQGEIEYVHLPDEDGGSHVRLAGWYQHYSVLFHPTTIFAFRAGLQSLEGGSTLPIQLLLPIGGTQTLRGAPQDRYLDRVSALVNAELRFPIIWRFGGVFGLDAGKVWNSVSKIDLPRWSWNPVAGIRYIDDRIIVRADFGFGKESTGFYLNFGQLF